MAGMAMRVQGCDLMRVACVVAGSRGDAQPFIALARACAEVGMQPVLLTHREHAGLAQRWDVPFREMPGDPRAILASPAGQELLRTRDPIRVLTRLRGLADDLFDQAAAALEVELDDCDAVIFSTLAVAAYHVAELLELPRMWGVLQPVTATSAWPSLLLPTGLGPSADSWVKRWVNRRSHSVADALTWTLFGPATTAYRRRVGLPDRSWREQRTDVDQSLPVLGGWSQVLAPRPADWPSHVHVTGAWQLSEAQAVLPEAVKSFLAAGPPPVYAGLGSATVGDTEVVTRVFVDAARLNGQRLILSSGWAGLGEGLSAADDDVLVVGELPHAALFPQCAAVVHHAGAGTTHTALAAGVPAVPLPFWGDQPFWAQRSSATGAAVAPVPHGHWTVARLAAAMARATGEPWRRRRTQALAQLVGQEPGSAGAATHAADYFMAGSST